MKVKDYIKAAQDLKEMIVYIDNKLSIGINTFDSEHIEKIRDILLRYEDILLETEVT